MISFRRICSLILAVVFATSAAFGQSSHGAMAGTVTDPTGAVIPGAKLLAHRGRRREPRARPYRPPLETTDSTSFQ